MNRVGHEDARVQAGSLADELTPLLHHLLDLDDLSGQSRDKIANLLSRFASFLETGVGISALEEITPAHVAAFVAAPSARQLTRTPSASTQASRRSAVRLLFRLARQAGIEVGDPTLDLLLPERHPPRHRPLTNAEVLTCRGAALHSLTETRLPAAWALAEASARTSEIPNIRVSDLDLERPAVWLHGGSKTEPRWGYLSSWGVTQLERRAHRFGSSEDDPPLVYEGSRGGASAQAAACIAITSTLRRAGLAREPGVRPISVAAWAGRRLLDESVSLDEIARRLGIRSLDRAATFISFEWHLAEGPER